MMICPFLLVNHHPAGEELENSFQELAQVGTPIAGWFTMENPITMDDDWGVPPILGNLLFFLGIKQPTMQAWPLKKIVDGG